jgi:hypothetical protein
MTMHQFQSLLDLNDKADGDSVDQHKFVIQAPYYCVADHFEFPAS